MQNWDAVAFKALLRTTSQRLGQLQERKDSQGKLARRDIAAYLSQGHLALARDKAATSIQEDMMGDLLEELEMLVGTVGRHVGELGQGVGLGLREHMNGEGDADVDKARERDGNMVIRMPPRLSPALVEAAASIIHAAPSTESKDLKTVRDILMQRLGPAFTQTASLSRNNHVSQRITQILSSPPPTASKMDEYLVGIAQMYGVRWAPEPLREDLVIVISEILRADAGSSPIVDLPRLREICARGLPDDPPWVRPRIWRLLFGTLPILKTTWSKERQKQRDGYYDLVRRLLAPLASLPSPTVPLSPTDALLTRISDSLFRVSPELFILLGNEPKSTHLGNSSLDSDSIQCATNLDERLALLKCDIDGCKTPEIRLESEHNGSFNASLPPSPSTSETTAISQRQRRPTTLLPSKAYNAPPAHRVHLSALLRLLYIHSTLNPAVQSPHIPWLLVPLYSALAGETCEDDTAHVEADTFWVFEELLGEIAELGEEEGRKIWTRKLSERIKWTDGDLSATLHATGLDPILPHYSYRWLAPLLAQTLPLSSVFPIWDVLFARPARTRDVNPKLECLVDICTALLVRARTPLFRLGGRGGNAPGVWTQEHTTLPPPSPLRPWELSDAFTEGITLLTSYPIDAAGGIDRVLQTASDIAQKRIEARDREMERERENVGFGARIRQQMWKGFTNQVSDGSPEEEVEGEEEEEEETDNDQTGEQDDGNETETPAVPTLTSRLANTVWRGITNQSSMDDEVPSPPSPLSGRQSPSQKEERLSLEPTVSTPSSQATLWNYAGKIKDSDTVAAFSKVSSNWRAKALDAWRVRKGSNASASSPPMAPGQSPPPSATSEIPSRQSGWPGLSDKDVLAQRRGSLPGTQHESAILDPPRPAFFRSPRESFLPQPRRQHSTAPSSPNVAPTRPPLRDSDTESSAPSFIHRAGASLASLTATQSSQSTAPKSVPRPLMLSSRDLMTTKSSLVQSNSSARSEGGTPEFHGGVGQWGEILSTKNRHALRQESVSSISSLSPSEAMIRPKYSFPGAYARGVGTGSRSDYESDGSVAASRRVPLNRKSVSPMALASRSPHLPWNASSSPSGGGGRGPGHPLSNGSVTAEDMETTSDRGWRHFDEERVTLSASTSTAVSAMTGPSTGPDSPTTIGSPPVPSTPLMPAVHGPGAVRIVNGGASSGGGGGSGGRHGGTSSISTLSETSEMHASAAAAPPQPLEPPVQSRLLVRKKTPPLPPVLASATTPDGRGCRGEKTMTSPSESEASSEMSLERTPLGKAPVRLRSKRYAPRSVNLRLRPVPTPATLEQQQQQQQQQLQLQQQLRTPSPRRPSLTPEWPGEPGELATTPKMESCMREIAEQGLEESFGAVSSRPPFVRKSSKEARLRKVSTGSKEARRTRDSAAEEGDDEGYDDLLSAYESEDGSRE